MVKIQFYQAGHPHEVQEIEIDVSPSSSATMLMKQLEDHMTGAVIVDITFGKSMYENVLIFMAIAYIKSTNPKMVIQSAQFPLNDFLYVNGFENLKSLFSLHRLVFSANDDEINHLSEYSEEANKGWYCLTDSNMNDNDDISVTNEEE